MEQEKVVLDRFEQAKQPSRAEVRVTNLIDGTISQHEYGRDLRDETELRYQKLVGRSSVTPEINSDGGGLDRVIEIVKSAVIFIRHGGAYQE